MAYFGEDATLEFYYLWRKFIEIWLIGVSKLIIDLSHSRYFCDQHLEIYVSPNFGDRTPCNKNSFNLK